MAETEPSSTSSRRVVGELAVRWQEPLADFQTVSRPELVTELEAWLADDKQAEPGAAPDPAV